MSKRNLAILKKVSLAAVALGIIGTIGFVVKFIGDLGECPPYVSGEACLQAYLSMTSYGKYVYYGSILSPVLAGFGIIAFVVWFFMNRSSKRSLLSPEQIELKEAEKEYSRAVKDAEKAYRSIVKALEKNVSNAEKALRNANEMGRRKLAKHQSITLFEDRIEAAEGTTLFESGNVETEVHPSGKLIVKTAAFESMVLGKPEQFEKAREFAEKIRTAVSAAPRIKEEKTHAIDIATRELAETQVKFTAGKAAAEEELAKVRSNTSRVDLARAVLSKRGLLEVS